METDINIRYSENATIEADDITTAKLLICYLLYKINKSISEESFYEIVLNSHTINYFLYKEALCQLIDNMSVASTGDAGNAKLSLLNKGRAAAKEFRTYIPKALRDHAVIASIRYFSEQRLRKEFEISYEEADDGVYVICKCDDSVCSLMNLRLFAPNLEQAEFIGKNIRINPIAFYGGILDLALFNTEAKIKLDNDSDE